MSEVLRNSVERVVQVRLQPLSEEAFLPYGSVLALGKPIYPEMEGGKPVVFMTRFSRKDGAQRIEEIATHYSYNQTITVLKGTLAIVVAPPPRNREARFEDYEFDYDRAAAFIMEAGMCVDIGHGTWHSALAITDETLQMTGTRYDVPEEDFNPVFDVESGKIPVRSAADKAKMQSSIEHINLRERDNCILEVVL